MNSSSPLILFGGNAKQINRIFELIPNGYELHPFPLTYRLTATNLQQRPLMIILIHNPKEDSALEKLAELQKRFPKIPTLVIGEQAPRSDIIQAFRLGVKDFLLFPVDQEAFTEAFARLLQVSLSDEEIEGWGRHVMKWIWPSQPKEQLIEAGRHHVASANQLGIVPAAMRKFLRPVEVNQQHDLAVNFFGDFSISFKGKRVKMPPGKKVNALLAFLLFNHERPIHRERLMEKFWGDNAPSSARNSLNVAIHAIRKHFQKIMPEHEILLHKNEYYSVNSELDITSDVQQFLGYWQKGRATENSQGLEHALGAYNKAVALYQGDFLEAFRYESWSEPERDNLEETYLLILERLSSYFSQISAYHVSINICKKILKKDPCLEEVHRKLINCYFQLGLRDKAIRQFQKCVDILQEELGVAPSEETLQLVEEINLGRWLRG